MKRLLALSTILLTFVLYAIYSAGAMLGNIPTTRPAVAVAVLTVCACAVVGLIMAAAKAMGSVPRADGSVTLVEVIRAKYGELIEGVVLTVTHAASDVVYPTRLYTFKPHGSAPSAPSIFSAKFRVLEISELHPALAGMFLSRDAALQQDRRVLVQIAGTPRIDGAYYVQVMINAEDAGLFGVLPCQPSKAFLVARKIHMLCPQACGLVTVVTNQSIYVTYKPQVYSFDDPTAQKFKGAETEREISDFKEVPDELIDAFLAASGVPEKTAVSLETTGVVPLMKLEMDEETAKRFNLPFEEVATSTVVARRVREQLTTDPSIQGLVVTISDVPEGVVYLDTVFAFDDGVFTKLKEVDADVYEDDLDNTDADLEAALRGEEDYPEVVFGEVTQYLGAVRMIVVRIRAEDASFFGINPEDPD